MGQVNWAYESKNNIFNFFSGCGFLAILIVASAFFVCCVSCCSNKRRPSRITPDVDCGHGTYLPHTTQPSSAILHQNTSYNISNSVPFVSSHCNYDRNSITAEVHTYLCKQRYLYNCTNQLFLLNILLLSLYRNQSIFHAQYVLKFHYHPKRFFNVLRVIQFVILVWIK